MKTVAPLLLALLLAAPVQAAPPSSGTAVSTSESRPAPRSLAIVAEGVLREADPRRGRTAEPPRIGHAQGSAGADGGVEASAERPERNGGQAPSEQDDAGAGKKERKPPPFGFGGWAHFGGGTGAMIGARKVSPVGRVDIGFGGYLFLLYGGLAANVTFSQHMDLVITGVAYGGLALPIPLIRPLIGFKFGGGLHQDFDYGPSPAIQLGPQIGVHIGQIAGSRFGIRVMVDAEALVSTKHRIAGFSVIGTVALML